MAKKSWAVKFNSRATCEVKQLDKTFWGMPVGSKMLIPTPKLIEDYINSSEPGSTIDVKTMRNDLAIEYQADFTCPLTTGIFLRIVAEANFEKLSQDSAAPICPFWRMVDPQSDLAKKLSFGTDFIVQMRAKEKV